MARSPAGRERGTAAGPAPHREESARGYEACGQNYRLGAGRTVQDTAGPEHRAGVSAGLLADSIFWGGTGCQSRIRTRGPGRGSRSRWNHPQGARPSSGRAAAAPPGKPIAVEPTAGYPQRKPAAVGGAAMEHAAARPRRTAAVGLPLPRATAFLQSAGLFSRVSAAGLRSAGVRRPAKARDSSAATADVRRNPGRLVSDHQAQRRGDAGCGASWHRPWEPLPVRSQRHKPDRTASPSGCGWKA